MITMGVFSNPYRYICIVDGELKFFDSAHCSGEYNQGIAECVDNSTIIGLYCQNNNLFLVRNNDHFDFQRNNISCQNSFKNNRRIFELIVDGHTIYRKEYAPLCSISDLISGDLEDDFDFLLYLTNTISSNTKINEFIRGHSL